MPPRFTLTASAADVLPVRVTVKTIGSLPVSAPVASVTATDTVGSTGAGPMIVTLCVAVVVLPKTSVAVHVIVVTPTANRLPVGTPVRVTATPGTLSVAVAVPRIQSLT